MRKILYVLLVSTIVFWGVFSYAEWTTDKDSALAELLQERIMLERNIQDFIKAGHTELTTTKILKYLDEKEKQLLLNALVDEKVVTQTLKQAEADAVSDNIDTAITSLNSLKE